MATANSQAVRFVREVPGLSRPSPRRRGFTLVELLVVIGIIALLVAMLVPYLVKSKELARRAVCSANVKTVAATLMTYSSQNNGQIPLAYQASGSYTNGFGQARGTNMLVRQSQDPYFLTHPDMHFGALVNDKLVQNPRAFFCPSQTIPRYQFDTEYNGYQRIGSQSSSCWERFGYCTRPLAGWGYGPVGSNNVRGVIIGWPNPWERSLPRVDQLQSTWAMVCDYNDCPSYVYLSHGDGFNFSSVGGSVRWMSLDNVNAAWFDENRPWAGDAIPAIYDEVNQLGVWFDMDKQTRG